MTTIWEKIEEAELGFSRYVEYTLELEWKVRKLEWENTQLENENIELEEENRKNIWLVKYYKAQNKKLKDELKSKTELVRYYRKEKKRLKDERDMLVLQQMWAVDHLDLLEKDNRDLRIQLGKFIMNKA